MTEENPPISPCTCSIVCKAFCRFTVTQTWKCHAPLMWVATWMVTYYYLP